MNWARARSTKMIPPLQDVDAEIGVDPDKQETRKKGIQKKTKRFQRFLRNINKAYAYNACHTCESRYPLASLASNWIPAFAGMTNRLPKE